MDLSTFCTAADVNTEIEAIKAVSEHRGAIGAESEVMERACKKVEMEKRRAITQQKHVEETIIAAEKEAEKAVHVPRVVVVVVVVLGWGGDRHKPR